jgi:thiol:disulfide interchange protein DsbD
MFAMSLGLGFPYLFLALFSNLIQSLPRSGDWMLWVKQVFGVLMVAIGLNYVLNGLHPAWALWVMPAALLLGGIYLGFLSTHGSKKPAFRAFRAVAGIGGIIAGLIAGDALMKEGVRFAPYDAQAVQAAFAGGRPVMMDFSASWCLPCHELEQNTFTHGGVKDLATKFATFKVDLTRYDAPESQALRAKFGVTGVPEVLFFTPDGREMRNLRVIGFLTPELFLQRMHHVLDGGKSEPLGANVR